MALRRPLIKLLTTRIRLPRLCRFHDNRRERSSHVEEVARTAECPVAARRRMEDQNMNDKRKAKIAVLTVMGKIDGRCQKSTASEGYGQEEEQREGIWTAKERSGRGAGL